MILVTLCAGHKYKYLALPSSGPSPPLQILSVILIGLLIPLATLHYQATAAVGVGLAAVLLFAVAIVGIVAALTHHQVVLFCVSLNQWRRVV